MTAPVTLLVPPETEARFWRFIGAREPEACWTWKGGRDQKGYGIFWAWGRSVRAHRFAYELLVGPIPAGLMVMHEHCDNPPCCNVAHLVLGTNDENVQDRNARRRVATGERNGAAKLTAEKALEIRERWLGGESASAILGPEFRVSPTLVRMIGRGELWKHAVRDGDANDDIDDELVRKAVDGFPPSEEA